jgi:hypothetical protein
MERQQHKSNTLEETVMDPTFKAFLESHTRPAEARIKMVDVVGLFRSTLNARDMKLWPRWRFAKELAVGGYIVRKDANRVSYLMGRRFQTAPQAVA